jgi:hypothetical protein
MHLSALGKKLDILIDILILYLKIAAIQYFDYLNDNVQVMI